MIAEGREDAAHGRTIVPMFFCFWLPSQKVRWGMGGLVVPEIP
ncbi:MAG: hypothetical protein M2R45_04640 [Verrucomicrobia subdivision 3 bacterium]|nr:hypothetical protein [Limisphaerales bacterium]MCS1417132.1 hypothetical protein [Limisphaerales bacterium]